VRLKIVLAVRETFPARGHGSVGTDSLFAGPAKWNKSCVAEATYICVSLWGALAE